MIQVFSLIGAIAGILGGILVSYKKKSGFYVWIISNGSWIIAGVLMENWALVAQFGFLLIICFNGIRQWEKS